MSSPIASGPATEEKTNLNLAKPHCATIGITYRLNTVQDAERPNWNSSSAEVFAIRQRSAP